MRFIFCALALALFSRTVVASLPTMGANISHRMTIGSEDGEIVIPLPSGVWNVAYAGKQVGKLQDPHNFSTPRTYAEVILVQHNDNAVIAILDVTVAITHNIKKTSTNPCTRKDLIYQNKYDSSVWEQRCLEVNHFVGGSTSAQTKYVGFRSYLATKTLKTPDPLIAFNWYQFDQFGHNWFVRYGVNPAQYGLTEVSSSWINSPWHRDNILRDAKRSSFMNYFIGYSQQYSNVLHESFKNRSYPAIGTFQPPQHSVGAEVRGTDSDSRPTTSAGDHVKTCLSLGFKPNTQPLYDCIVELAVRAKK